MSDFPWPLERRIHIRATRDTVFRFFTDSARFATWWGEGSAIDSRPGGRVAIRYPNGVTVSGEVIDVAPGERISFTYGYDSGEPIPPRSSRVTITLEDDPRGTWILLRHEFADESNRDAHAPGWRYQLAVFANAAAAEQHAGVAAALDRFFAVWSEIEAAARARELAALASDELTYRDRFGCVMGRDEFNDYVGAVQMHLPAGTVRRDGDLRHCQGTALADWIATGADGTEIGRGTSVFELLGDGRIDAVVAFWRGG